ncbi:MAG: hypothetical protein BMS9Abin31_1205 [Gammaproteobacteria bacterium]|nr:MAG: hypothetical protein BMS9Abin31_1205 [Gammaproteobacteria bacterium]
MKESEAKLLMCPELSQIVRVHREYREQVDPLFASGLSRDSTAVVERDSFTTPDFLEIKCKGKGCVMWEDYEYRDYALVWHGDVEKWDKEKWTKDSDQENLKKDHVRLHKIINKGMGNCGYKTKEPRGNYE